MKADGWVSLAKSGCLGILAWLALWLIAYIVLFANSDVDNPVSGPPVNAAALVVIWALVIVGPVAGFLVAIRAGRSRRP